LAQLLANIVVLARLSCIEALCQSIARSFRTISNCRRSRTFSGGTTIQDDRSKVRPELLGLLRHRLGAGDGVANALKVAFVRGARIAIEKSLEEGQPVAPSLIGAW
jgi:hypothetical protein